MSMLKKIHRRISPKRTMVSDWRPQVTANDRIYAVGDIHGRADLLVKLHERIQLDAQIHGESKKIKVVYLGDYVDRGLESRAVIDILVTEPLQGIEHIFLKGNHEDMLLRSLEDSGALPSWFAIGGDATALSYGVGLGRTRSSSDSEVLRQALLRRMPSEHRRFFENLQLSFQSGDYVFVHAGIRPNVPLEEQDPQDLMWIREDFLNHKGSLGAVVVHGHSISLKPEMSPERIGIDTGAYATNVLSCLVLQGRHRKIISTTPPEIAVQR